MEFRTLKIILRFIFLNPPKKSHFVREPPVDNVVAADYKEDIFQDLLLHMSCPQHCQTALGSFLLLKQTDARSSPETLVYIEQLKLDQGSCEQDNDRV